MNVYIYKYIYIHISEHKRIDKHTRKRRILSHAVGYTYVFIYDFLCMGIFICIHIYLRICVYISVCMSVHICVCRCIHIYDYEYGKKIALSHVVGYIYG
jgi:hypothetical protein